MRILSQFNLTVTVSRARWSIPLTLGLLAGSLACGQGAETKTGSLRGTVARWVARMQQIQEEQSRWTREREVLESNREGLEQEIIDLKEAIASTEERIAAAKGEEKEKLEKRREYDAAREVLAGALTAAEVEAQRVIPLIPEFYLKDNSKLAVAVEDLKKTASFTEEEKQSKLGARLNTITLVLSEVEKFQTQIWVKQEQREVGGEEKLVDTIYFGLSTALAADEQESVALRGTSSASGWSFVPLSGDDVAARIRELLAVAKLEGEIKFVEVPLELR